jgi:ABC-type uncharacterized transport system auxiliary subunit
VNVKIRAFALLVTVAVLSTLSGCSVLGVSNSDQVITTYVLNSTPVEGSSKVELVKNPYKNADKQPQAALQAITLAIAPIRSSSFDNRENLVFAHQANTRATYQYALWSEKPSRRLEELLFTHLEQTGVYQTIAPVSANVVAEHLLVSELLEFYHDASQSPGLVKVKMRFSLYHSSEQRLLGRKTVSTQQTLQQFDAQSAAKAFNQATAALLTELSEWLSNDSLVQ